MFENSKHHNRSVGADIKWH